MEQWFGEMANQQVPAQGASSKENQLKKSKFFDREIPHLTY
jgi:hypothetical protein